MFSVLDPTGLTKLREMSGGDEAFLAEMIDTFLADAPKMLAEARQSFERGDAPTLRRAAHSLKSNSAEFGAKRLSELCRELEMMGKAGEFDGAGDKLAQADVEYAQVKAALESIRQGQ